MSKLYMMKGLPASGKSTKAKELVAAGAVRVNRDLLREMMNFGAFKDEGMVVDIEKFVVSGYLGQGKDVVVDDNKGETLYDDDDSNEVMKDSIENYVVVVKPELDSLIATSMELAYEAGRKERDEELRKMFSSMGYLHTQFGDAIPLLLH